MELKDAFKELERFAAARARGATVVMWSADGRGGTVTLDTPDAGKGFDASCFLLGSRIKEIIEPKVLRDWTTEDAKKHVGFAIRLRQLPLESHIINARHFTGNSSFTQSEYAAPIPGTDPAEWDWKPCKVEVPAEKPESESAYMLRLMSEMTNSAWTNQRQWIIGRLSGILSEKAK